MNSHDSELVYKYVGTQYALSIISGNPYNDYFTVNYFNYHRYFFSVVFMCTTNY